MNLINLNEHFTFRNLTKIAFPCIFMFFIILANVAYNLINWLFMLDLFEMDFTKFLHLIIPGIIIFVSAGSTFGMGSGALISINLNRKKEELAKQIFTLTTYVVVIFATILTAIVFFYLNKILNYLAIYDLMLFDIALCAKIIIISFPFFILLNYFSTIFVLIQKPFTGLFFVVLSIIMNVVGNIILVYVMEMGIFGAVIATTISYFLCSFIQFIYFLFGKNKILKFVKTDIDLKLLAKICINSSSGIVGCIAFLLISILYNLQLSRLFGINGIVAHNILLYIDFIYLSIFIGYSVTLTTVIGYKFGLKDLQELKHILKIGLFSMFILGSIMALIINFGIDYLITIIIGDSEKLQNIMINIIKIHSFSFIVAGINTFCLAFFIGINEGKISSFLIFIKMLILESVAIMTFPILFSKNSIWLSALSAEIITLTFSLILLLVKAKNDFAINSKEEEIDDKINSPFRTISNVTRINSSNNLNNSDNEEECIKIGF